MDKNNHHEQENLIKQQESNCKEEHFNSTFLPIGIALGVAFGAALGSVAIGIAIGVGIGTTVGSIVKKTGE